MYILFYSCFGGLDQNLGNEMIFVMHVSNYLYTPNYNILFQFKSFGVEFHSLPNLI